MFAQGTLVVIQVSWFLHISHGLKGRIGLVLFWFNEDFPSAWFFLRSDPFPQVHNLLTQDFSLVQIFSCRNNCYIDILKPLQALNLSTSWLSCQRLWHQLSWSTTTGTWVFSIPRIPLITPCKYHYILMFHRENWESWGRNPLGT